MPLRHREVLGGPRAQGTLTAADKTTIKAATGVQVSVRGRNHGPNAGRRVCSYTATADVTQEQVDEAVQMVHDIILQGIHIIT